MIWKTASRKRVKWYNLAMPEQEHFFTSDGVPAKKVVIEVPEEFNRVVADLTLKNNQTQTPHDMIIRLLIVGVSFLQVPEKGGAGGVGYVVDDETRKVSIVVTPSGFDTARALYPNVPVTIIPDPLAQNPFLKKSS